MSDSILENKRLSRRQKEASDYEWYKERIRHIGEISFRNYGYTEYTNDGGGEIFSQNSRYRKMITNYDMFNNIIDEEDFKYVIKPFGDDAEDLPADFTNKDIVSGKVKALLGMEMKRPFSYKVVAVNEEASTRIEEEQFGRLKTYVINTIMQPIRLQLEQKYQQEESGQPLTREQEAQIQQQISQELETMTPDKVKRYMKRDHQDPAEAMSHQILQYLTQQQNMRYKFNKGFKHALLSAYEVYLILEVAGRPTIEVVNPIRFDYDKSPDTDFIEDGEWATYEMRITPAEIIKRFDLSNKEIDDVYKGYVAQDSYNEDEFFDSRYDYQDDNDDTTIRVTHVQWKALKPIKFREFYDEEGEVQEDIVDELYKYNEEAGDISVSTEWIPCVYEGYQINVNNPIFTGMREVPGQFKDLDNLYECKLSYVGAVYDNINSEPTALMSRMKVYQYYYNVIMYRIELLMASDEGKQVLINMNLLPKSSGIDVEKWMHYLKTSKIGFMNPNEEGNRYGADITNAAKEIDRSLASDMQKYIMLAEYIEKRCGESVGIPKQVEGQFSASETATNVQQALIQSSNILEPYFELHNHVKKHALQALLECAKTTYVEYQPANLSFILDDMSREMLNLDFEMLDNSTYGIFVSNSLRTHEALQATQQLAHAALQNQKIELSDVIKIMRSESPQEAEEMLLKSEGERMDREAAQARAQEENAEKQRQFEQQEKLAEREFELEKIRLQEGLKTERELQKQVILSAGFNEDKDADGDGVPDLFELYKFGKDADLKASKQKLDENKFKHQQVVDAEKIKLEKKKINKAK